MQTPARPAALEVMLLKSECPYSRFDSPAHLLSTGVQAPHCRRRSVQRSAAPLRPPHRPRARCFPNPVEAVTQRFLRSLSHSQRRDRGISGAAMLFDAKHGCPSTVVHSADPFALPIGMDRFPSRRSLPRSPLRPRPRPAKRAPLHAATAMLRVDRVKKKKKRMKTTTTSQLGS